MRKGHLEVSPEGGAAGAGLARIAGWLVLLPGGPWSLTVKWGCFDQAWATLLFSVTFLCSGCSWVSFSNGQM